jgi:DNA invertase Pin-like site-specific DNA recombinase
MSGELIGYARVSTTGQSLEVQQDALKAFGVKADHIFAEKQSGTDHTRPELKAALKFARKGDTFVVTRIDRLARSTHHLCQIAAELDAKGAFLKVLEQDMDTTTSNGRLTYNILAAIAQFETELRAERQAEGIAKAKEKGVKFGRKGVADDKVAKVLELAAADTRVPEIMEETGLGRATIYRLIAKGRTDTETKGDA